MHWPIWKLMRGDYRHNKTRISCNYRKHFIMTQALHYACQIRYTALCNWIRHFVLTLRISIFDFVFHYADVILCMTLSERILVANRATLEPSATHSNISRHIFHFHTSQHGEQWFGKFRKCLYSVKLQPSFLKTTRQVILRPQPQAAVWTQHRHL